jgi:ribosomal protein L11 methyltransferase
MSTQPPLWKASVPCKKADAPDIVAALELAPPSPQAVLVQEDPFKDNGVVEALYDVMPDGDVLTRIVGKAVHVQLLPDADWIKLSQEGLPPVRAGRFFVYGAHDAGKVPHGVIPMKIEAGQAFGTGHHETTALCLSVLSALAKLRRFNNVLDIGCGTGLLAIGAAKLWHQPVTASDIDPIAIEVARENAVANGVGPLIQAVVADGPMHPILRTLAPYDLILANILAGPLMRLAPSVSHIVAKGGVLVLSGLLHWQEIQVLSYYRPHGLKLIDTRRDGSWSALILEKA